jgi:hypothetical protein
MSAHVLIITGVFSTSLCVEGQRICSMREEGYHAEKDLSDRGDSEDDELQQEERSNPSRTMASTFQCGSLPVHNRPR